MDEFALPVPAAMVNYPGQKVLPGPGFTCQEDGKVAAGSVGDALFQVAYRLRAPDEPAKMPITAEEGPALLDLAANLTLLWRAGDCAPREGPGRP